MKSTSFFWEGEGEDLIEKTTFQEEEEKIESGKHLTFLTKKNHDGPSGFDLRERVVSKWERVCVCVCVREKERESESVCVWERQR